MGTKLNASKKARKDQKDTNRLQKETLGMNQDNKEVDFSKGSIVNLDKVPESIIKTYERIEVNNILKDQMETEEVKKDYVAFNKNNEDFLNVLMKIDENA